MRRGHAGARRCSERLAGSIETLVRKRSRMEPRAELVARWHAHRATFLIPGAADLRNDKTSVADAKACATRVALLRITGSGSGRIAVEESHLKCDLAGRRIFEPNAGGGEWVGRAAARQVGAHDCRPAERGIDEVRCVLADEEFVIGCDLSGAHRRLALPEQLFDPEIE